RVPAEYIRKQTIKTAERYITPELKEFEKKVLEAEDRSRELEYRIFGELRDTVAAEVRRILATARALATLDVTASLAEVAARHRYVAPVVDDGLELRITDGRHPVIERGGTQETFVPNDSLLDDGAHLVTI